MEKVLSGRASRAEQEELENWIAADPEHAEEFSDLQLLHASAGTASAQDSHVDSRLQFLVQAIEARKHRRKWTKFGMTMGMSLVISATILLASIRILASWGTDWPANAGTVLSDHFAFHETVIAEILEVMEREYDVEFRIQDRSLLSARFTGTFSRGTKIEEVVDLLAQSANFYYVTVDPKIFELRRPGFPE